MHPGRAFSSGSDAGGDSAKSLDWRTADRPKFGHNQFATLTDMPDRRSAE